MEPVGHNESQEEVDVLGLSLDDGEHSAMYDSEHASMDDSEHASMDDSEYATIGNCKHSVMDNSEHAGMDESEHAVMDDSKPATMDDSDHAIMEDREHAAIDDSEHTAMDGSEHDAMDDSKQTAIDDSEHATTEDSGQTIVEDSEHAAVDDSEHAALPPKLKIRRFCRSQLSVPDLNRYYLDQWEQHHQLVDKAEHCDLLIRLSDGELRSHVSVLTLASPVLRDVLLSGCGCGRGDDRVLLIPDLSTQAALNVLQLIYSGRCLLPADMLGPTREALNLLGLYNLAESLSTPASSIHEDRGTPSLSTPASSIHEDRGTPSLGTHASNIHEVRGTPSLSTPASNTHEDSGPPSLSTPASNIHQDSGPPSLGTPASNIHQDSEPPSLGTPASNIHEDSGPPSLGTPASNIHQDAGPPSKRARVASSLPTGPKQASEKKQGREETGKVEGRDGSPSLRRVSKRVDSNLFQFAVPWHRAMEDRYQKSPSVPPRSLLKKDGPVSLVLHSADSQEQTPFKVSNHWSKVPSQPLKAPNNHSKAQNYPSLAPDIQDEALALSKTPDNQPHPDHKSKSVVNYHSGTSGNQSKVPVLYSKSNDQYLNVPCKNDNVPDHQTKDLGEPSILPDHLAKGQGEISDLPDHQAKGQGPQSNILDHHEKGQGQQCNLPDHQAEAHGQHSNTPDLHETVTGTRVWSEQPVIHEVQEPVAIRPPSAFTPVPGGLGGQSYTGYTGYTGYTPGYSYQYPGYYNPYLAYTPQFYQQQQYFHFQQPGASYNIQHSFQHSWETESRVQEVPLVPHQAVSHETEDISNTNPSTDRRVEPSTDRWLEPSTDRRLDPSTDRSVVKQENTEEPRPVSSGPAALGGRREGWLLKEEALGNSGRRCTPTSSTPGPSGRRWTQCSPDGAGGNYRDESLNCKESFSQSLVGKSTPSVRERKSNFGSDPSIGSSRMETAKGAVKEETNEHVEMSAKRPGRKSTSRYGRESTPKFRDSTSALQDVDALGMNALTPIRARYSVSDIRPLRSVVQQKTATAHNTVKKFVLARRKETETDDLSDEINKFLVTRQADPLDQSEQGDEVDPADQSEEDDQDQMSKLSDKSAFTKTSSKAALACVFCGLVYGSTYQLHEHYLFKHLYKQMSDMFPENEKNCPICDKSFTSKNTFIKHYGLKHKKVLLLLKKSTQRPGRKRSKVRSGVDCLAYGCLAVIQSPFRKVLSEAAEVDTEVGVEAVQEDFNDNIDSLLSSETESVVSVVPYKAEQEEELEVAESAAGGSAGVPHPPDLVCCGAVMGQARFLVHCVRHHARKLLQMDLSQPFKVRNGQCTQCELVFTDFWAYCDHVGAGHRRVIPYILKSRRFAKYRSYLSSLDPGGASSTEARSRVACPLCTRVELTRSLIERHLVDAHYYAKLSELLKEGFAKRDFCDCKCDISNLRQYIRHFAIRHNVLQQICTKPVLQFLQEPKKIARSGKSPPQEKWSVKREDDQQGLLNRKLVSRSKSVVAHLAKGSSADARISCKLVPKEGRAEIFRCQLCKLEKPGFKSFLSHLANSHYRRELKDEFAVHSIAKDTLFKCPRCGEDLKSSNIYGHLGSVHEEVLKYAKDWFTPPAKRVNSLEISTNPEDCEEAEIGDATNQELSEEDISTPV